MINKFLGIILLLLTCLISCTPGPVPRGGGEGSGGILLTSGCPEVDMIPKPSYSPKAVYVLLDNSGSYAGYYADAAENLQKVLVQTLRPGDFFGLGLIGEESANTTMSYVVLPDPQEPLVPHYTPTLTPLPDDALGPDLRQHEIENGGIEKENEELKNDYYCLIEEWNESYDLLAAQRKEMQIFQTIHDSIPEQSQAEGSTDIQSAMFNAHDFFRQARKQGYTNLKLILFSDLAQTEPPREWSNLIDLSGVYVTAAMVPFDTSKDEISGLLRSEEEWSYWFGVYQVADFELLTVPNSTISTLSDYVRD